MAKQSVCVGCKSHEFELVDSRIGGDRTIQFVQCAECGRVVGAVDDTGTRIIEMLRSQNKRLKESLDAPRGQ